MEAQRIRGHIHLVTNPRTRPELRVCRALARLLSVWSQGKNRQGTVRYQPAFLFSKPEDGTLAISKSAIRGAVSPLSAARGDLTGLSCFALATGADYGWLNE
jgi:hypothetical protein